jgi:hypothetical protein
MRPTGLPAISNVIVAIAQTVPAVPAARPVGDRADDVDTVISAGWYEGLYKATGKVARARFAHAWTMRDGKVARFEQIVDSATFNAALSRRRPLQQQPEILVRGVVLQGVTISASTMSRSLGVSGWSESDSR